MPQDERGAHGVRAGEHGVVHRPEPLRSAAKRPGSAIYLSVTGRRLQTAAGLDAATHQDILHISARAGMALDLVHPTAARRELERLEAIARRWGAEP